jgi:hypothetical protein
LENQSSAPEQAWMYQLWTKLKEYKRGIESIPWHWMWLQPTNLTCAISPLVALPLFYMLKWPNLLATMTYASKQILE